MRLTSLILIFISLQSLVDAQSHDSTTSIWTRDTFSLYSTSPQNMHSTDTLTVMPVKCCLLRCLLWGQYDGYTIGLGGDIIKDNEYWPTSGFDPYVLLSFGRYFKNQDLMIELEGQYFYKNYDNNQHIEVFELGISSWKNILYVPVAKGTASYALLRPGIKLGFGSLNTEAANNTFLFAEPKLAIPIPPGRAHLYYSTQIRTILNVASATTPVYHQFGLVYYLLLN